MLTGSLWQLLHFRSEAPLKLLYTNYYKHITYALYTNWLSLYRDCKQISGTNTDWRTEREQWLPNCLSFCYPENLSLIFWIISVQRASLLPWKYLLVQEEEFFVHGKCPNFSMRLHLRMRGNLMLANFRLKIKAVWDSSHIENRSSNFSHKQKAFGRNNLLRFLIYLKLSMNKQWKKLIFQLLPRN